MLYIAHRGNYNGKNLKTENTISQIEHCMSMGLDVEIDVWYAQQSWWLGHDHPKYQIDVSFLTNTKLWCHAKNSSALFKMLEHKNIHCFWHNTDDYTLTSRGYIWAYPGSPLDSHSVCVLPERSRYSADELSKCAGICSDHIIDFI